MQVPLCQVTDLFQAGDAGYTLYRIPGLVVASRGILLAYGEARRDASGDWGQIDLYMRRSTDNGRSWSPPLALQGDHSAVLKNPVALRQGLASSDEHTHSNPVAIADRLAADAGSVVHLLYCVEYARCFYRRSDDDGQTFSAPVELTPALEALRPEYDWRVLATGPGHGIQLRNGCLLVPVWLSTGTGGHGHHPSCVTTLYSDDHGATWQAGEIALRHAEPVLNPSESSLLELEDGRVLLNARSESLCNRRVITLSDDGRSHWSPPHFDEQLFEPICCAGLVRLSGADGQGRSRILFSNPDSLSGGRYASPGSAWPRENLTVRLSYDEGRSWPIARVLDAGPSGYSDLAVGADGMLYCFYERGSLDGDGYHTAALALARFNLEWLTAGQDSLGG